MISTNKVNIAIVFGVVTLVNISFASGEIFNRMQFSQKANLKINSFFQRAREMSLQADFELAQLTTDLEKCILFRNTNSINSQVQQIGAPVELDQESKEKLAKLDKDIKQYTDIFENDKTLEWEKQDYYFYQAEIWKRDRIDLLRKFSSEKSELEDSDIVEFENNLSASRKQCQDKYYPEILKILEDQEFQMEFLLKQIRFMEIDAATQTLQDKKDLVEVILASAAALEQVQHKRKFYESTQL